MVIGHHPDGLEHRVVRPDRENSPTLAVESSDGGGPFQHIVPMARSIAAAKAPTPIEPGTIEVTANVTLTVEVGAAAR